MTNSDLLREIAEITKDYPRFKDGRIDYTHARVCPVIICTVVHGSEVLLTHRSADVIAYPDTWNGVAGFIDEIKPLEEIVRNELAEEVAINADVIKRIVLHKSIVQVDDAINREWIAFPVLVELLKKPVIKTNWENKAAKWVPFKDISNLKLVPFYPEVFKAAMKGEYAS